MDLSLAPPAPETPSVRQRLSRACPRVAPGPLRQHHLGLPRLLAHSRPLPPHQPHSQQTLEKAMRHRPSSQPLLILRCIPALKMEKLRTYTVETKKVGWHEATPCGCSPRIPRAAWAGISSDCHRLWEGDSTPGTLKGDSAPQRRPSGSWQAGLLGDGPEGGWGGENPYRPMPGPSCLLSSLPVRLWQTPF